MSNVKRDAITGRVVRRNPLSSRKLSRHEMDNYFMNEDDEEDE